MTSSSVEAIGLALLTGVVGWVSYMAATRANRETALAASKAIDAEAFERAKDIYLAALETARADLAATRLELTSTRQDLLSARADMRDMAISNQRMSVEM